MDFHVATPRGPVLVMRVVDGVLEMVPPAPTLSNATLGRCERKSNDCGSAASACPTTR